MDRTNNPFHDLWLTEILNPDEFVQLFSGEVAKLAEDIFGTGNVVVRGRQGSGKSMLLRLLDANTKVAFAKSGESSPIPENRKFVTGNINLTRSNFSAITNRFLDVATKENKRWAAATFSDFLNYTLALNLMKDINWLDGQQRQNDRLEILTLNMETGRLKRFVKSLSEAECWNEYLGGCKTWLEVEEKMEKRLVTYRRYFNFNIQDLPSEVEASRTEVGVPLAELAQNLRDTEIIPSDCQVFLKIDQIEELYEIERESGYGDVFRQVINRALAQRDERTAYRLGTRHYAWSNQTKVWGTSAHLEEMRDYSVIDIDEILRKHENLNNNFSTFAEDVFKRRLTVAGFKTKSSPLSDVFGLTGKPSDRAKEITNKRTKMHFPDDWAPEWVTTLKKLGKKDPLEAKLGEVWLRQKSQQEARVHLDGSKSSSFSWQEKEWWCKERHEAAIMQIASETGQNMIWYGKRHIIDLSGWNILAFMSICRTIWSGWLRKRTDEELLDIEFPTMDKEVQKVGIYEASKMWVDKLHEGQEGDRRRDFIFKLAEWFLRSLKKDKSLSYPGYNGFSLLKTEYEINNETTSLIRVCKDYGDLIESDHTSKAPTGRRIKWYLNPILCPYFGLPHIRTKEPIYTSLDDLLKGPAHSQERITKDLFESQ